MHRGYLIDLENVQSTGLDGIEQLTADDTVLIFYSNKADNLKIDVVKAIHESQANVEYIKVYNGTPNALDFQLITYLFYYYDASEKDAQYWIISKDTGYDAAIKMSKRLGANNVKRAPAIKNAVHYKIKGEKIAAFIARKKEENEEPAEAEPAEEEDVAYEAFGDAPAEDSAEITEGEPVEVEEVPAEFPDDEPEGTGEASDAGAEAAVGETEAFGAETEAVIAEAEAAGTETEIADAEAEAAGAGAEIADVEAEAAGAETEIADAETEAAGAEAEIADAEAEASDTETEAVTAGTGAADDTATDKQAEEIEPDVQTLEESREERGETVLPEEPEAAKTADKAGAEETEKSGKIGEKQEGTITAEREESASEPAVYEAPGKPAEEKQREVSTDTLREFLENECGVHADPHTLSVIRTGLKQCEKRGQFYQFFRRHLGGKRGAELYRNVKNHLVEMQSL